MNEAMTQSPASSIRKGQKPGTVAGPRHAKGFTMLELMAILLALSALAFVLFYKTQSLFSQQQALDVAHQMAEADQQLQRFAAQYGRLPCPDTGTDGIEDCGSGAAKGFLPYRTLGLATKQYRFGEIPLRYGVYRNATDDADLAVATSRFDPTDSDGNTYPTPNPPAPPPPDVLDFCTGLKNAAAATASTSYTYLGWPDASTANVAFALAYAGNTDSDGVNGLYDGLNGASGPGFNAPGTPMTSAYDDTTSSRGFDELFGMLRCDITQRSLNLASNSAAVEADVVSMASGNSDAANMGVILNAIGTAITVWGMVQSIAAIADASEVEAESAALLATAIATCVVLVGCALIPVYTTAVTFATVGLVGSIAAAVLTAAALGLQIAATVFYVGIAAATGPPSTGTPATPYVPVPATQSQINAAWNNYHASQVAATNALNAYNTAAANLTAAQAATNLAKTAMDANIAASSVPATIDPLIYGQDVAGRTVSPPAVVGTPTSSVTSTGTSICTTSAANPPVTTCVPPLPYNQTSSSTPLYKGNCIGPFPGISTTTNPGNVLNQAGCTTTKTYTDTQTTVTTTFTNPTTANWSVTTTITNYQSVTTVPSDYVYGAAQAIDNYEKLNAPYQVNGTLINGNPPSSTQAYTDMNNAINAIHTALINEDGIGCILFGGAFCPITNKVWPSIQAYLTDYQNQQLLNYEVNGVPQVGTGPTQTWNSGTNSFDTTPASPDYQPAVPSPLGSNRDRTAAAAENALDAYNTLVCSTGSTLVGQPSAQNGFTTGTTPGGTGTSYDSSTNMCTAGTGGGSSGTQLGAASGALNILNLLRTLGSVK
jgi:type II secretory pathway pseudopilin PulG